MLVAMATSNLPDQNSPALHGWLSAGDAPSLDAWIAERIAAYDAAIQTLLDAPEPRTVENTLRPFDDAANQLSLASNQSHLLYAVGATKELRDAAQLQAARIAAIGTELALNPQVYHALAAIDSSAADAATRHYLERTLLQYRLAGVDKDDATAPRIKELQEKATLLSLTFSRNVQENVNTVTVEEPSELYGLPEDFLQAHRPGADGKITLTTDFPDYLPVMTFAQSAALRRRMFLAYNTRAFPQNRQILLDLLAIRKEIATILGFSNWADLATADQMMESAANMRAFLDELDVASKGGAEKEYSMILAFARSRQKGLEEIDAASRGYWLEQYRRSAFEFDSQSVRPYFPYESVEQGVLATAARLFQVEFRRVSDTRAWHSDVVTYEVYEQGSANRADRATLLGRFYLDMHPREGKDKWFSAHPLIPGVFDHPEGEHCAPRQIPEAALICNFPGGKPGEPGLMQHSDVVTYFHEFGHLMHALLGGHQRWAGLSGIATEGDFVEVPSQMLEEFFRDHRLLATFAHHYETGEPIPAELMRNEPRGGFWPRRLGAHAAFLHHLLLAHCTPRIRLRSIWTDCSSRSMQGFYRTSG